PPLEDAEVALGGQAFVSPARQRGMSTPDDDQLLVVAAEPLVARQAGAREDLTRAPRHVAPVVRPLAARATHFLAVIDDGNAPAGELQDRCEAEQRAVTAKLIERARHVVVGEIVREEVPGPH